MKVLDQASGANWTLYNADTAEAICGLRDRSVGFSVFSPPFAQVYSYSASDRDLGNTVNPEQFFAQHEFITRELMRVMIPGRLVAVHAKELPTYGTRDGVAGRYDFPGDLIRHYKAAGFIYWDRVDIGKNPQRAAQAYHPQRLAFAQKKRDRIKLGTVETDVVLVFRAPGNNPIPVTGPDSDRYAGVTDDEWIAYAHGIWTDINETDVLPVLAASGQEDERHLCPLQLPVIERCVRLWSNPGDVVFSPFAGVGSEGVVSLRWRRKFLGCELKPEYFKVAAENLRLAEQSALSSDLFTLAGVSL